MSPHWQLHDGNSQLPPCILSSCVTDSLMASSVVCLCFMAAMLHLTSIKIVVISLKTKKIHKQLKNLTLLSNKTRTHPPPHATTMTSMTLREHCSPCCEGHSFYRLTWIKQLITLKKLSAFLFIQRFCKGALPYLRCFHCCFLFHKTMCRILLS